MKTKTQIQFQFYNSFSDEELGTIAMPRNPKKALYGYYSKWIKGIRMTLANLYNVEKRLIRFNLSFIAKTSDRIVLTLPSGISLDVPDDLTPTDIKIINLRLEEIRLAKGL